MLLPPTSDTSQTVSESHMFTSSESTGRSGSLFSVSILTCSQTVNNSEILRENSQVHFHDFRVSGQGASRGRQERLAGKGVSAEPWFCQNGTIITTEGTLGSGMS